MIRVGQKLFQERLARGLTLEDISAATKIKTEFLEAIEKGEYGKLPSSAYAQGFVRNYTSFLGLSEKDILPLFRREFNEKEFRGVLPEGFTRGQEIAIGGLKLSPLGMLLFGSLVVLFGFLLFQYRFAIIDPPLEVSTPKEGEVVPQRFLILGKTDPNATISVNEEEATVASDGTFRKTISVFPGSATIVVKAKNRIGRESTFERHVEVK